RGRRGSAAAPGARRPPSAQPARRADRRGRPLAGAGARRSRRTAADRLRVGPRGVPGPAAERRELLPVVAAILVAAAALEHDAAGAAAALPVGAGLGVAEAARARGADPSAAGPLSAGAPSPLPLAQAAGGDPVGALRPGAGRAGAAAGR